MSIAGLSTGKLVSKFKRELRSSKVKSSEIALSRSSQLEKLNLKALFPGIIRYHAQFRGRGTAHSLVERVCTAVSEHTLSMHFSRFLRPPGSLLILYGLRSGSGSRAVAARTGTHRAPQCSHDRPC